MLTTTRAFATFSKSAAKLATVSAAVALAVSFAQAQNARPDFSQLPAGSNNMFPPIQSGNQPAAAATPVTAYSAPAVPAPNVQYPNQFPSSGFPQNADFGQQQMPTGFPQQQQNRPSFDPNQFRGFNPTPFQGQTGKPETAREERFVPSEVVSGLPPAQRSSDLRAVLRTTMGDITIKLDRINAPQTVAHFVALSRGDKEFIDVKTSKRVKRPFYNGLTFHRVSKGFLIQTGCPFGNGRGGPGDIAMVGDELKPNMLFNRPGLVAMAPMREGGTGIQKNSNGSQFFISMAPMPDWDSKFTIFGEVEEGMDVVAKIAAVKVGPTERPIKRVFLGAVDIFEGNGDQQTQVPAVPPVNPDQAPPPGNNP
ncbi:MAG: peptidylprolyl isomerase [Bdellovibrionota bacterium]